MPADQTCARNDIYNIFVEAFPDADKMKMLQLANRLLDVQQKMAFEALYEALTIVPLHVQAEQAALLATEMRAVLKRIGSKYGVDLEKDS